jgi:hypothetical protein
MLLAVSASARANEFGLKHHRIEVNRNAEKRIEVLKRYLGQMVRAKLAKHPEGRLARPRIVDAVEIGGEIGIDGHRTQDTCRVLQDLHD